MDPSMLPSNPRFGRYLSSSSAAADPPPAPLPRPGHRRAHSEVFLRAPDDVLFDSDPDFGIADIDFPSLSDDNGSSGGGVPAPGDDAGGSEGPSASDGKGRAGRPPGASHLRSLSVDSAFFDSLGLYSPGSAPASGGVLESDANQRAAHHARVNSLDGSASSLEAESAEYAKKAMPPNKLAELALIDPKRAKRILANRQSAARSKERKIRYTSELEKKVQTLQTEATTLSAQVTVLQRDTVGLTAENKELKLRLQAMEQEAHLRDAINDALRGELQSLKLATEHVPSVNGNTFGRGLPQPIPQFFRHPQQLHSRSQPQHLHISQPSSNDQPLRNDDSMDIM
uniref:Transcription factor VIP1 n=1 Tax=Anthurium amnicola TaxID=1678845 RepID=A0A1D1YKH5_9ARAE